MIIDGTTALVTGGGSGLGAATARALAAKGARVTVLDRNAEAGAAIAGEINGLFAPCDVADPDSAAAALAASRAAFGVPRILINCAGVAEAGRVVGRDGPLPLDIFERTIRINLIGTFNMLRLAAAEMSLAEPLAGGSRGVVVSTASIAAFDGQIGQAAYAASKGGVAAMTLPVARELARFGIRVLAIAPGLFKTPLLAGLPQDTQDGLGKAIPFPARLGDPAEFAQLVIAMVENDYLNGEVVRLDGALRMQP
ncbi:SDR family NAD(P)-dependent oxidoreductase [Devosia lacusdianchii]|uniref:SDR family NAD(P)-dependent oxidoreductase n=1 Tax=Devosia lacusdianchii TaxID=2917991 RepID=UPI001F06C2FD|nr:SDR family NAD(P)-dependent oxidoreductase [Devosia sp. JXJ CY 41]